MTDRYERIRAALAMGPTPGSREVFDLGMWDVEVRSSDTSGTICQVNNKGTLFHASEDGADLVGRSQARLLSDAFFIAACDPDTIRELLEERDQLAAALEAAREDGWQPIETAPNGAWLLVHSDRGWIGLARRSDPDYAPDEGWFEDEHTEFLDPAWLTHWRPLPAPPANDQARGKGVQS